MEKYEYDYLLVGAGLFNAIFAYEAAKNSRKCLIIEKRSHIGGNLYCENIEGITVHRYGAHIFHTRNKHIWDYINQFCDFNNYVNSPLASYEDKLYNLPFNMNTFYQLWGVKQPKEAMEKIESQRLKVEHPKNFEEQALSLVGTDIYHKLIKGYTEKQWGMDTRDLPAFLIKRLPLRFTFNNNYFDDPYQGIPIGGYNGIFETCFQNAEVILDYDFTDNREIASLAKKIIYTGTIDQYYNYCYGQLEYRSLKFEDELIDSSNFQGNAVVNYTDRKVPYTRILEHKHFESGNQSNKTLITREYPQNWTKEVEPYYPINTDRNNQLYQKYNNKANREYNLVFTGRLGSYLYYDMDRIVFEALTLYQKMKRFAYLLILIMMFSSCQSIKYVPVESVRTEYKTRDVTHFDSIFQKDSIYMLVKSDTIYRTEIKYRYKYLNIHKSDTVLRIDSILTPYPVEKQLTKWQETKIELGGWAFGVIIIVLIVFAMRLTRKFIL